MKPKPIVYVQGAERMVTAARLTTKGLYVRFADDREGVVPYFHLELKGFPVRITVRSWHVVEVYLRDRRVKEVTSAVLRRYAEPDRPGSMSKDAARAVEESPALDPRRGLGERLCALRARMGVTQKELALRTGISRVTIARVESGARLPRYRTLRALAHGLSVPIERLTAV